MTMTDSESPRPAREAQRSERHRRIDFENVSTLIRELHIIRALDIFFIAVFIFC